LLLSVIALGEILYIALRKRRLGKQIMDNNEKRESLKEMVKGIAE